MEEIHFQLTEVRRQLKRGDMRCDERQQLETRRDQLLAELTETTSCSEWAVVMSTRPAILG